MVKILVVIDRFLVLEPDLCGQTEQRYRGERAKGQREGEGRTRRFSNNKAVLRSRHFSGRLRAFKIGTGTRDEFGTGLLKSWRRI